MASQALDGSMCLFHLFNRRISHQSGSILRIDFLTNINCKRLLISHEMPCEGAAMYRYKYHEPVYENANPTCISTNGRGPFSKNPFRFFCVQFSILADIILFRRTLYRDYINRVIIHFYYNHGRRNQFNIEVL